MTAANDQELVLSEDVGIAAYQSDEPSAKKRRASHELWNSFNEIITNHKHQSS
jgi:hypothetical protein